MLTALRARATTALSEKVTLKFISPQLWPPNSPDMNPVHYDVREYCERRCTKHASVIWSYRRRHWRILCGWDRNRLHFCSNFLKEIIYKFHQKCRVLLKILRKTIWRHFSGYTVVLARNTLAVITQTSLTYSCRTATSSDNTTHAWPNSTSS